ncbi:hypothetical protein QJS66_16405 [Kocuria rhizophila]|nr:hypothetical protein QJS66_16405 [Kocuria rhizophila]
MTSHPQPTTSSAPQLKKAEGQVAVVQLKGQRLPGHAASRRAHRGQNPVQQAAAQVQAIRQSVDKASTTLASESAPRGALHHGQRRCGGVALQGDAAKLRELAKRSDVVKVSRPPPSSATTRARSWTPPPWTPGPRRADRQGRQGVAIIHSGIDYTHADFGTGHRRGLCEGQASTHVSRTRAHDRKKFVGYDLAGDDDHALSHQRGKAGHKPPDCEAGGHGTHVSRHHRRLRCGEDGRPSGGDHLSSPRTRWAR